VTVALRKGRHCGRLDQLKMRTKFWVAVFFFNITGLSNSLLANELDLLGVADPYNGLQVLALYIGQFTASLVFIQEWKALTPQHLKRAGPIVLLDIVSNIAYWTALLIIGSGLTTVVYSSIVVFSALFQLLIFGKRTTYMQLIGIIGVIVFVGIASLGQVQDNAGSASSMVFGILLAVGAAAGFAMDFVWCNYLLELPLDAGSDYLRINDSKESPSLGYDHKLDDGGMCASPDAEGGGTGAPRARKLFSEPQVQAVTSLGIVPSLMYVLAYTVPYRMKLVLNPVHESEYPGSDSWSYVWIIYGLFVLSNGLHQTGLYHSVGEGPTSAVTAGINKGLQAALTFVGSAIVYCHVQHAQCFSVYKGIGCAGVCLSVFWYGAGDYVIARWCKSGAAVGQKDAQSLSSDINPTKPLTFATNSLGTATPAE